MGHPLSVMGKEKHQDRERPGHPPMGISPFAGKIPSLLRSLNAIRTYFAKSGKPFWKRQYQYTPSLRDRVDACAKAGSEQREVGKPNPRSRLRGMRGGN